jgi:hypothetical protein
VRRLALALALVAAIAVTGCGSSSSTPTSAGGLADALSFVPKGAPIVVAVNTDPNGSQWQQVDKLVGRFPFAGQVKADIIDQLSGGGSDLNRDVKPLLGNDFVIAPPVTGIHDHRHPLIAWKPKDAAKARAFLERKRTKIGTLGGAELFRSMNGQGVDAIKDGVIVSAPNQAALAQAFARHSGSNHETVGEFNAELGGLRKDALVRAAGNLQTLVAAKPGARKVPWLAALRSFGATLTAQPDGDALDFAVRTAGGLTASELPLASGAQSPPVIRRPAEVGIGIRSLTQTIGFFEALGQATDPAGFARFRTQEADIGRQLGVNVERDVIAKASGNASISIGLDHSFAASVPQSNPAQTKALLARSVPRLPQAGSAQVTSVTRGPGGLYVIHRANGRTVYLGLIGTNFVIASDAARAAQIGTQQTSPVSGAKGALAIALDARSIVNAAAQRAGAPPAVQFVTGALGDFTGSVESETTGLTGHFKLTIK